MLDHKVLLVFEDSLVGLWELAVGDTLGCRRGEGRRGEEKGGVGRGGRGEGGRVSMQNKQARASTYTYSRVYSHSVYNNYKYV